MFNRNFNLIKNSVCSVFSDLGTGTGWLYRRNNGNHRDKTIYVVTAAHIVVYRSNSEDIFYNPSILVHNVNNSRNNQIFETKIISIDKKGDIALLEIQNHRGQGNKYSLNWSNHTTLRVNRNIPSIGIPIYIVGYPLGIDYNSLAGGYLRENNAFDSFTPTSLYYNLATSPGNSGSPVFNTNNEVIGMLQWGISNAEQIDGGIRGDILYYFLENSINKFITSSRTLYNSNFDKNYIGFFGENETSFISLSGQIIKYLIDNFSMGSTYNNGGRNINGVILLYNGFLTNLVLENITYTNIQNQTRTITLSSCINDKSSIWEVIYFAKPSTNIILNIFDLDANISFNETVNLTIMPQLYDFYLTEGFSINNNNSILRTKDIYDEIINILKDKSKKDENKEKITNNSNILLNKIKNKKL